jgi:hypothetical protein
MLFVCPFWKYTFVYIHKNRILRFQLSIKHTLHMTMSTWNKGKYTQVNGAGNEVLSVDQPYKDLVSIQHFRDRPCGLVVRVLGYRSGGPG